MLRAGCQVESLEIKINMGIISKVGEKIASVLLRDRKGGSISMFCLSYFCWNQTWKNFMSLRIRRSWNSVCSLRGREGTNTCWGPMCLQGASHTPPPIFTPTDNPKRRGRVSHSLQIRNTSPKVIQPLSSRAGTELHCPDCKICAIWTAALQESWEQNPRFGRAFKAST